MPQNKGNEDDGVIRNIVPKEGEAPSNKDQKVETPPEPVKPKVTEPKEPVKTEKEEEPDELSLLKAENEKLKEERDNYKRGLLSAKSKQFSFGEEEPEKELEGKWDDETKEFQKQTLSQVERIMERREIKRNEKSAIRKFLENNSEVSTADWNEVVTLYKPVRGKDTPEDILEDLEDAYVSLKRKNGTLKQELEEAEQKGEQAGVVKAKAAQLASVSGSGNHAVSKSKSKSGVSDTAKYMAGRMNTPIDKLEKEDDSITAVRSI